MENIITLNIHCETDSDFSESLISALNICNKEVSNSKRSLKQEHEARIRVEESLTNEKTEHIKTQEALKQEHEARIRVEESLTNEKIEHNKTQEALKQEHEARIRVEESLTNEKTEHNKTQEALKQEHEARIKVEDELRRSNSNLFNIIKAQFDEISNLLYESVDTYNNDRLKEYVQSIINQDKGGWSECDSIDDLLHNLKVGSGAICRVVNIIWWSKQDNLEYMTSMVKHLDEIERKMELVNVLFKVAGHTINYPTCEIAKTIPNYKSFDDERSNFIDIFSSENYDNDTLCEVRLLSIDGNDGKMYIYYK